MRIADRVNEVKEIKHYFNRGVKGRTGIERQTIPVLKSLHNTHQIFEFLVDLSRILNRLMVIMCPRKDRDPGVKLQGFSHFLGIKVRALWFGFGKTGA